MRGQRLFVRPIEPGDRGAIESFLAASGKPDAAPACGLLGKLVGDLVAVLGFEVTDEAVMIDHLTVAPHLTRTQIGRFMIDEAERLARKLERTSLVVDDPGSASDFFLQAGFIETEGRMVRIVQRR